MVMLRLQLVGTRLLLAEVARRTKRVLPLISWYSSSSAELGGGTSPSLPSEMQDQAPLETRIGTSDRSETCMGYQAILPRDEGITESWLSALACVLWFDKSW